MVGILKQSRSNSWEIPRHTELKPPARASIATAEQKLPKCLICVLESRHVHGIGPVLGYITW